jgi:hypothetical protein
VLVSGILLLGGDRRLHRLGPRATPTPPAGAHRRPPAATRRAGSGIGADLVPPSASKAVEAPSLGPQQGQRLHGELGPLQLQAGGPAGAPPPPTGRIGSTVGWGPRFITAGQAFAAEPSTQAA